VEPVVEAEAPVQSALLETMPISEEEAAEFGGVPGQILEACPACGSLIDVSEIYPFSKIYCPSCAQGLRARKQFNNYLIIDMLGEGGMGSVFKALDCNLNRHVALKIVKRELSSQASEHDKLVQEARLTASVNHPHVVKVFSFGDDHGQFYLAMELVEKGSLDDLMSIQKRIAEAQVLEVGIQIAQGLEAALDRGLIHRDIKPGNILFADARTAKLVDFGLAIVMDEAAQARGEIWGTPYYIAPEKLDQQPEDFRSDIYSLGGSLFHALAGRPPYEAASASMVALKQLKSQPISLQAFAPEVSSETAYVINRMLAKNPDDRYQSYEELTQHLSYARAKLLERAQRPMQPRARVVMETAETRRVTGLISLIILAAIVLIGVGVYLFRDKLFPVETTAAAAQEAEVAHSAEELTAMLSGGLQAMAESRFDEAKAQFDEMKQLSATPQPMRNWILMNAALATMMAGDPVGAAAQFKAIQKAGVYPFDESDEEATAVANFFVQASKPLSDAKVPIAGKTNRVYSPQSFEGFALLAFALHNWQLGAFPDALELLQSFSRGKSFKGAEWIATLKPLGDAYLNDAKVIVALQKKVEAATTPDAAKALIPEVAAAREKMLTGSAVSEQLDKIQEQLDQRGAE
jgi:hypothetical protein